jgi:hypothetical protein
MRFPIFAYSCIALSVLVSNDAFGEDSKSTLAAAGKNPSQIEKALAKVPPSQREGMEFLVENMPQRDLDSLSSDYLLENTRLAYQSWREDPWAKRVPKAIFLNNVLP